MSPNSVGERLRTERVHQGLDLNAVAAQTRISLSFLEAIEAGNLHDLPGAFFARSFIRQYAAVLGIDWGELERDLSTVLEPETPAHIPSQEPPREVSDIPPIPSAAVRTRNPAVKQVVLSFVVFILVMVACSVVYSMWERFHRAPETGPAAIVRQQPVPSPAVPLPEPGLSTQHPATPEPQPGSPAPANPANPERLAPGEPVRQASQPQAGSGSSLDLSATEETWVSVSTDGKTVFMGILKPGETKVLGGIQSARLLIGNAGGLQVRWNAKLLGPFGPRGQVRMVELTPNSIQVSLPHKARKEGAQL